MTIFNNRKDHIKEDEQIEANLEDVQAEVNLENPSKKTKL